jgi:hypothetical protein
VSEEDKEVGQGRIDKAQTLRQVMEHGSGVVAVIKVQSTAGVLEKQKSASTYLILVTSDT